MTIISFDNCVNDNLYNADVPAPVLRACLKSLLRQIIERTAFESDTRR